MPNNISHLIFAEEVSARLGNAKSESIKQYPDAYRLGSLGFDFLYILRELKLDGARMPNRLHRERTAEVLRIFFTPKHKASDTILKAYGFGLATHYVLDKTVHPLVYFLAEETLPPYYPLEYQCNLHNLIETEADEWVLQRANQNPRAFDAYPLGKATRRTKRAVAKAYAKRVFPLFGNALSAQKTAFCLSLWNLFGKLWNDPSGTKKRLISCIEKKAEKRSLTALFRPTDNPNGADLLNTAKKSYPNPRNSEFRTDESFSELYARAVTAAVSLLSRLTSADDLKTLFDSAEFSVNYEGIDVALSTKRTGTCKPQRN